MDKNTAGKIVVVDDLHLILEFIKDSLEMEGITTIVTFDNPHTALKSMQKNGKPSLVITDYNMPGMTGLELLKEITKTYPELPGFLVSSESETIPTDIKPFFLMNKNQITTTIFTEVVKKLAKY